MHQMAIVAYFTSLIEAFKNIIGPQTTQHKIYLQNSLALPNKTHIFVAIQILDIKYEVLQGFRW